MEKSIYDMSKEEFYTHYKTLKGIWRDSKSSMQLCNIMYSKVSNKEKIKLMRDIDVKAYNKLHNIKEVRGRDKLKRRRRDFFNKVQSIISRVAKTQNEVFMLHYLSIYDSDKLLTFKSKLTKEDKLIMLHNKEFFSNIHAKEEPFNNKLKYVHSSILTDKKGLDKIMTGIKDFMYQIKHKHEFNNRVKRKLELMKYADIDKLKEGYENSPDEYTVILTNNKKKVRTILETTNKSEAISFFEQSVKKHSKVLLPQTYSSSRKKVDYELLLVKSSKSGEKGGYVRDRVSGKMMELVVKGKDDLIILNKASVYVENDFFVYGYHPQKQRKTFKWINDNLITPTLNVKKTLTVRIYGNKIFLFNEDLSDFNLIICRNSFEAESVTTKLAKVYSNCKYIHILPKLKYAEEMKRHMLLIREKTGWDYRAITHPYFYVLE